MRIHGVVVRPWTNGWRRHDRYRDAESKKSKSLFHDQKRFEGRNSFRLFMNHRYKDVVVNFATVNYERCSILSNVSVFTFYKCISGMRDLNKRNDFELLEQRNKRIFFFFSFSFFLIITINPLNL